MIDVPIFNDNDVDQFQELHRVGVPFAPGQCPEGQTLEAKDAHGDPIATQTRVLSRWPDGSMRWGLLRWVGNLPAHSKTVRDRASDGCRLRTAVPCSADQGIFPAQQGETGSRLTPPTAIDSLLSETLCAPVAKSAALRAWAAISQGARIGSQLETAFRTIAGTGSPW